MNFKEILRKIVDRLGRLLLPLVLLSGCFFSTGCPEAQQVMQPVVETPAEEPAEMPTTTVGETKQEIPEETEPEPETPAETAEVPTPIEEPIETKPEEPVSTVTLPPGYELPPELIPDTPPVLSKDERSAEASFKVVEWDPTAPNKQTEAGKPADLISILPLKEREEVYNLFVMSVDLPFFDEVAERMREVQIQFFALNAVGVETGNWTPYHTYRDKMDKERGLFNMSPPRLEDIYFQENPDEIQYSGGSRFWMILEWYRLQLAHPEININVDLLKMENLYRESCANGMIFGLDNPWD